MTASSYTAGGAGHALRPHGAWIVAGALAVAGLALAATLSWQDAGGEEGSAPPVPAKAAAPAPKKNVAGSNAARPVTMVAAPSSCLNCGVIETVQAVKKKGEATGAGAVVGAVGGAVVGNQVGKGNGKKAMTVIGAVGGGVAGHEIEKQIRATTVYEVKVRMDDGSTRTIERATAPSVGQRVRLDAKGGMANLPSQG